MPIEYRQKTSGAFYSSVFMLTTYWLVRSLIQQGKHENTRAGPPIKFLAGMFAILFLVVGAMEFMRPKEHRSIKVISTTAICSIIIGYTLFKGDSHNGIL